MERTRNKASERERNGKVRVNRKRNYDEQMCRRCLKRDRDVDMGVDMGVKREREADLIGSLSVFGSLFSLLLLLLRLLLLLLLHTCIHTHILIYIHKMYSTYKYTQTQTQSRSRSRTTITRRHPKSTQHHYYDHQSHTSSKEKGQHRSVAPFRHGQRRGGGRRHHRYYQHTTTTCYCNCARSFLVLSFRTVRAGSSATERYLAVEPDREWEGRRRGRSGRVVEEAPFFLSAGGPSS